MGTMAPMSTRLLIALAALGALIGLVGVFAIGDDTAPIHAAAVGPADPDTAGAQAELGKTVQSVMDGAAAEASTRTEAQPAADDAVGDGILIVKTLLNGEPHSRVQVALRGDATPRRAREDTEPWAFYLPSKTAVVFDITEEDCGWIHTETTLAPVAGDVRTLTVDLNPPQIDGEVLLQVRSDADLTPIAGAKVIAISEEPPDVVVLTTDGAGNARVPRGPALSYVVSASGYRAVSLEALADSDKSFKNVTLQSLARLYGKIQSQGGATTRVQLMGGDPASATDRHAMASATVDAYGSWAIEGIAVPKGQKALTGLWIELESEGTMRTLAPDLRIEPSANIEVVDPWIGGLPIELEFVYPSGSPVVAGTKIFLRREAETEFGSGESLGGLTDAKGRIKFPALYVGKWACEVGRLTLPELVVLGDSLQPVVIEGFECIAGSLKWATPNKATLRNAIVHLRGSEEQSMRVTGSSVNGDFRFDLIPVTSTFTITASVGDTGFFAGTSDEQFSSGEPITVTPGTMDLVVPMKAVQSEHKLTIERRGGTGSELNFDK